jgi:hypothetical protein
VTRDERADAAKTWQIGLDEELALLTAIGDLVVEQQQASDPLDYPALTRIVATRDTIITELARLIAQLRPIREALSSDLEHAPDLADLHVRQRDVTERAQAILAADRKTLDALADAQRQGQAAVHAIHSGGRTLAAYRRVTSPTASASTLFNQRG